MKESCTRSSDQSNEEESMSDDVAVAMDRLRRVLRLLSPKEEEGGLLGLSQRRGFFDKQWVETQSDGVWTTASVIVGMHTDEVK